MSGSSRTIDGARGITAALDATRELTGFDAGRVRSGSAVLVVGTEGVGVRTLVEACRELAPDLDLRPRETATRPADAAPAASPAGVALVVVDPSSSVGDEERQLVERMRATVGTVALVCTKIDAFWEWPRIVRAHRTTLDPFASMPLFGVSPVAALGGAVDESGVEALLDWIGEALAAPDEIRTERARVSAALGAVEHHLDRLGVGRDTPTGPSEPGAAGSGTASDEVDELLTVRRALVADRDRGRVDRLAAVRAGLARARSLSSAELHARVRDLAGTAAEAAASDASSAAEHGARLRASWTELAERVQRAVDRRIDEVRATALVGLDADTVEPGSVEPRSAEPGPAEPGPAEPGPVEPWNEVTVDPDRPSPRPRRAGAEDALLVVIGASTGLGVGRLVVAPMASVQTLQWISMPLALLLGVGVAAWVIRVRRAALARTERLSQTTDLLAEARSALDHQLGLRVAAAETRIAGQIARAYERRARVASDRVAELDDRIRRVRGGGTGAQARRDRERAEALRAELAAWSERSWAEEAHTSDGTR